MVMRVMRHAESTQEPEQRARTLTNKGIAQATRRNQMLAAELGDERFDLVLCSPLKRAEQTRDLAAVGLTTVDTKFVTLSELFSLPSTEVAMITAIKAAKSMVPAVILKDEAAKELMREYVSVAYNAIKREIAGARNVLIVTHSPHAGFIAAELSGVESYAAAILGATIGECDCIVVNNNGSIVLGPLGPVE